MLSLTTVSHGIRLADARRDDRGLPGLDNGELIVLLAGGDKSTQQQDIKAAQALAKNLKE